MRASRAHGAPVKPAFVGRFPDTPSSQASAGLSLVHTPMLMLKALRNRSIFLLWIGQATSSIGDEIYRVALVWLAVSMVGAKAGYLAAGQAAVLLLFSLIGGRWSDRWDHFKTLIWVDVLRAVIVMIPVLLPLFAPYAPEYLYMAVVWTVALSLSALSAFFEPALQTLLPRFAPNRELLQASTGLMSTTLRMARAVGPSIIGVLSGILPMMQFFSLDAVSFFVSMLCISALRRRPYEPTPPEEEIKGEPSFRESVMSGFRLVRKNSGMSFMIFAKSIAGGAWNLAYGLGLVLLVRKLAPGDMRAFSLVLGTYGLGNIGAALVLGNIQRIRLTFLVYSGYIVLGVGFVCIALAPSLPWLLAATAFTAIGGPLNDLPFVDLVQQRYRVSEIPKIFRLRMALETGATLVGMLAAPTLFLWMSARGVVGICGLITFAVGAWGLLRIKAPARHFAN